MAYSHIHDHGQGVRESASFPKMSADPQTLDIGPTLPTVNQRPMFAGE